ncbi:MAG: ATP/GTP-binding protein [Pyrinomonadaceae bacterium]
MQEQLKLIVSGPVGAGKTTFIKSISEIDTVDTDVKASEDLGKEFTTVAMDYGLLTLDGIPLHIYGTPGQDRFDFMWDVLCKGALGLLLLVRGDKLADFPKSRNILDFITSRISVPFLVGVTHFDSENCWDITAIADFFDLEDWQVIGINATKDNDCLGMVACILELIIQADEIKENSNSTDENYEFVENSSKGLSENYNPQF